MFDSEASVSAASVEVYNAEAEQSVSEALQFRRACLATGIHAMPLLAAAAKRWVGLCCRCGAADSSAVLDSKAAEAAV